MDPTNPSRWGRCEIMTVEFEKHYYLIMETVCLVCLKNCCEYYSYNLSIMILELATNIELWAYDTNQDELK